MLRACIHLENTLWLSPMRDGRFMVFQEAAETGAPGHGRGFFIYELSQPEAGAL